jgi:hypothetical protein
VLSKVRRVHTLNLIDAAQPVRILDQQIHYSPTSLLVTRRRFTLNEGLNKRLDLRLPCLQSVKDLTCD